MCSAFSVSYCLGFVSLIFVLLPVVSRFILKVSSSCDFVLLLPSLVPFLTLLLSWLNSLVPYYPFFWFVYLIFIFYLCQITIWSPLCSRIAVSPVGSGEFAPFFIFLTFLVLQGFLPSRYSMFSFFPVLIKVPFCNTCQSAFIFYFFTALWNIKYGIFT